jgi:hypothetical protein
MNNKKNNFNVSKKNSKNNFNLTSNCKYKNMITYYHSSTKDFYKYNDEGYCTKREFYLR